MAHTKLAANARTETGSAASRRLRRKGLVPGVLYQSGGESLAFSLDERELRRFLHADGARTSVVDITIGDGTPRPALIKEWQLEPVRGAILHVDLQQVDLTVSIQAPVSLVLVGNPVGVRDGGVLDQPVREVTVEGLPDALPDTIEFDVSGLATGDTAHVSDLTAPEGVAIVDDPETVIASVTLPTAIEEEPEEEAAEPVEGAPAEGAEGAAGEGEPSGGGDEE